MKLILLISHPFILIASFSLVYITGHDYKNIYIIYLAFGLLMGEPSSIAGALGILIILFSYFKYRGITNNLDVGFINLLGALFMIVSLFLFFYRMRADGVSQTFVQILPLISLLTFCILVSNFV